MSRKCLKCGHVNEAPSDDPLSECPKCGAIYARVEEALKARAATSTGPRAAGGGFKIDLSDVRVRYALVAVFCFSLGVFAGREHVKYELRSAMREAASGLAGVFGGREKARAPEGVPEPAEDIPAGDGPFGLVQGLTLEELGTAEQLEPGKYKLRSVPKPHASFESYIVQVAPKAGLCWIKAIGKDVRTSGFGVELKSAFDDLRVRLESTYGRPELYDRLLPDSIWEEQKYFMMSLLKKERLLAAIWKPTTGDLGSVGLIATASSGERGYLSLEYSFKNEGACDQEIKASQDGAL